MFKSFIFVALGGAIGAMGRFSISLIPVKTGFPVLTLITNVIGAVMIGFIVGAVGEKEVSQETVLFWKVGVCGGFTTFSTFSLETYELIDDGSYFSACVYTVLSVVFCVIGIVTGKRIAMLVL